MVTVAEEKPKMSEKSEKAKASRAAAVDEKMNQARLKNLDLAITQIQKDFGEAAIMRLGDDTCICLLYTSPSPRDRG